MNRIKNTDNPNMLVYYLYHTGTVWKDLNRLADTKGAKVTEFYHIIKPALEAAPSKPYTNMMCNKFANTTRRGKASGDAQARSAINLVKRNFNLYGGWNTPVALEPKEIISDEELATLEATSN